MNIEENPIKKKISCDCCLTTINVKICKLEKCDYPLCDNCFNKVDTLCPKCRRKIKNDVMEKEIIIETLEIDLESQEIYRENTDKCCLYEIVYSYKIQDCLKYFSDTITNISIVFLIIILSLACISVILLIGRLVTFFLRIGCYDYWCKLSNNNSNVEIFCVSCFIGWSILGLVILFLAVCLMAGICFGNSDEDC